MFLLRNFRHLKLEETSQKGSSTQYSVVGEHTGQYGLAMEGEVWLEVWHIHGWLFMDTPNVHTFFGKAQKQVSRN